MWLVSSTRCVEEAVTTVGVHVGGDGVGLVDDEITTLEFEASESLAVW